MFCPYCGNVMQETDGFCPTCGKQPPSQVKVAPKTVTNNVPPARPAPAPQPRKPAAAQKPSSYNAVLLTVVAVTLVIIVVLLALAVGGMFFGDKSRPQQDLPAATAPTAEPETVPTEPPTTEAPAPALSTSNPYYYYFPGVNNEVMPGSDSRYLTAADLAHLEHHHLVVIRNEISARHGYTFSSSALSEFFGCIGWYSPDPGFSSSQLNKYEKANITLCDMYERKLEGEKFSSDNPYAVYYIGPDSYVMPNSSSEYLYEGDLQGMPKKKATLIRNEILARHGYTFEAKHLQEYFLQCNWYRPTTPPGSTAGLGLSKIENANINMLKAYENRLSDIPNLNNLDTKLSYKVSTDAFYLYLPAYWKNRVTTKNMSFSLKQAGTNYDAFLFDLTLCRTQEEFEGAPAYDLLGTITDPSGTSWYLVATYPTDVQWVDGYQELYTKMYDEIGKIQNTITANAGYTFTPQ